MNFRPLLPLFALCCCARFALAAEPFEIYSAEPADGADGVDPATALQVFFNAELNVKTASRDAFELRDEGGKTVSFVVTPDLGGAATLSPEKPLKPQTTYTLKASNKLRSTGGEKLVPFALTFRTGSAAAPDWSAEPRYAAERIDEGKGYVSIAFGADGALYVTTWTGALLRVDLTAEGKVLRKTTVWEKPGARLLGLIPDPAATAAEPAFWITWDPHAAESVTPGAFTSTLTRVTLNAGMPGLAGSAKDYITGLPNGAHPLNGGVFGPDKRLYLAQGSATHLGAPQDGWAESPLSAAVLVADVLNPAFGGGNLPVNCDPRPPVNYDPSARTAPVIVFASGLREVFDLAWHPNGQLYGGVNLNDTAAVTPVRPAGGGLPVLPGVRNIQPDEPLVRIVQGKHYGHPNPALGKYVLMGGNPTAERDPWEVAKLPVGTPPDDGFDPALLLFNLAPRGGQSANGTLVARHGALKDRLVLAFYCAGRTLHTFTLSPDGSRVTADAPLLNAERKALKFGAPLDVVEGPDGVFYVTDFQDERRGDSGTTGGIWRVRPLE